MISCSSFLNSFSLSRVCGTIGLFFLRAKALLVNAKNLSQLSVAFLIFDFKRLTGKYLGGFNSSGLITLSALASTLGGIVRPICFAVFELIIHSNFVGASIGKSAGFAPLRILSTKWRRGVSQC